MNKSVIICLYDLKQQDAKIKLVSCVLSRAIVEELEVAINNFKARFRLRAETYIYEGEFEPAPRFSLRMRVATQMLLEYHPAVRCLFGDASGGRLWRTWLEPIAVPLRAETVSWAEARTRMLADCVG